MGFISNKNTLKRIFIKKKIPLQNYLFNVSLILNKLSIVNHALHKIHFQFYINLTHNIN